MVKIINEKFRRPILQHSGDLFNKSIKKHDRYKMEDVFVSTGVIKTSNMLCFSVIIHQLVK